MVLVSVRMIGTKGVREALATLTFIYRIDILLGTLRQRCYVECSRSMEIALSSLKCDEGPRKHQCVFPHGEAMLTLLSR